MKNIKANIKVTFSLHSITLFLLCVTNNSFSMEQSLSDIKKKQNAVQLVLRQQQYFIHEKDNPSNGIWVNKSVLKKNSKALTELIKDAGDTVKEIPLNAPIEIIKLTFDTLQNKTDLKNASFQDMIAVVNLCNFLDVPADKLNMILDAIKQEIENDFNKLIELKKLNIDLLRLIIVKPTIHSLKTHIIKKYVNATKKSLIGYMGAINTAIFSPDCTKIVSGGWASNNPLVLWDITDPKNITHTSLAGHDSAVYAIAFSPDGTKLVTRGTNLILWDLTNPNNITSEPLNGQQGGNIIVDNIVFSPDGTKLVASGRNLMLWDLTDPNNITHKSLDGHPDAIKTVAFNSDGTKIISGGSGNQDNLILWDITDPNNITHIVLAGHPNTVLTATFNSDNTKIISSSLGDQENLILWSITNLNNIMHQSLIGHKSAIETVAFNPNGTQIISGGLGSQDNLILWNITDPNNITHQSLIGHELATKKAVFSPDGTHIISGGWNEQNNLLLWDITDPNNITHTSLMGHRWTVNTIAFSSDNTKIISGNNDFTENLILWTLLTTEQQSTINQIQSYNMEQLLLIYQLCLNQTTLPLKESTTESNTFKTLTPDMQQLLTDLFTRKRWFSNWW